MSEAKSKNGKVVFELPIKEFKDLCKLHCTLVEIAGWFDVSEDTIERALRRQLNMTYAEAFKKYSAGGKISLRRSQWLAATDKGNVSMMIWLGKQYLGQKETVVHSGDEAKPLVLAYQKPKKSEVKKQIEQQIEQEQELLGEDAEETN